MQSWHFIALAAALAVVAVVVWLLAGLARRRR
jgi:hypothetical protein